MARDIEKRKAYQKKWRAEHAGYLREYRRKKAYEYYWRDPEKFRELSRKYKEEHREEVNEYNRKYRVEHREEIRERLRPYLKSYRKSHQEEHRVSSAEQRKRFPDEIKARSAANHAIRDGKLSPQACEVCGEEKTQAHHDDYNYPLKVRWLCVNCHNEWHRNNKPIRVEKGQYGDIKRTNLDCS